MCRERRSFSRFWIESHFLPNSILLDLLLNWIGRGLFHSTSSLLKSVFKKIPALFLITSFNLVTFFLPTKVLNRKLPYSLSLSSKNRFQRGVTFLPREKILIGVLVTHTIFCQPIPNNHGLESKKRERVQEKNRGKKKKKKIEEETEKERKKLRDLRIPEVE